MKELVGSCSKCGKEVFCLDGFLNGAHLDQKLYCMDCYGKTDEKEQTAT